MTRARPRQSQLGPSAQRAPGGCSESRSAVGQPRQPPRRLLPPRKQPPLKHLAPLRRRRWVGREPPLSRLGPLRRRRRLGGQPPLSRLGPARKPRRLGKRRPLSRLDPPSRLRRPGRRRPLSYPGPASRLSRLRRRHPAGQGSSPGPRSLLAGRSRPARRRRRPRSAGRCRRNRLSARSGRLQGPAGRGTHQVRDRDLRCPVRNGRRLFRPQPGRPLQTSGPGLAGPPARPTPPGRPSPWLRHRSQRQATSLGREPAAAVTVTLRKAEPVRFRSCQASPGITRPIAS